MAKIRVYKDFLIELRDFKDGSYTVAIPPSNEGGEPEPVRVDLKLDEIETVLADLEAKDIFIEDLIPLGKALLERLLPAGTIREKFVAAVRQTTIDGGIRLRLLIRDVALQQIPWEFAYLQLTEGEEGRSHFMVLQPKISMIRHLAKEGPVPNLSMGDRNTMRMLAVMANPEAPGIPPLKLSTEKRILEKALGDFKVDGVQLTWQPVVENVTEEELDAGLTAKPDIFHFSGHGQFNERDDLGSLLLIKDKADRKPAFLAASALADRLAAAGVRLCVLGACESSRVNGRSAWTGVAPALIAAGVPAVLAMQYKVLDDMAILFSQAFYLSLAAGLTIDEAVTAGRLAMLHKSSDKGIEWGVPTLYLRATDGVLFPPASGKSSATAEQVTLAIQQVMKTNETGGEVVGIVFDRDPQKGNFTIRQEIDVNKGTVIGARFSSLDD